mmetsp:Transcript_92911/g.248623  ORF Transcript_92911/g.248623 Transcript_92911/m.248623 type:complete len:247 (+) Transcript_92911:452-1192(+)
MLVEQVNHTECLHNYRSSVMFVKNVLTRCTLVLGHDTHLFKQGNILVMSQASNCFDTGINTPESAFGQHLLVLFVVVVAIEDNLPVFLEGGPGDFDGIFAGFDAVGEFGKLFGRNRVEDRVDHGRVLRRTDGTELKACTTVGEGRSTVAIFRRDFKGDDFKGTEVDKFLGGIVFTSGAVHKGFNVVRHVLSEVGGYNRWRGFAGTEPEIVTGRADAHAHQITVLVNGGNNGRHDNGKGKVVAGGLG